MTIFDAAFAGSVLFVAAVFVRIGVAAVLRRWETARRWGRRLGWFVGCYCVALVAVGLALPRRIYAPGERRCFDDWCVTAIEAKIADGESGGSWRTWIAGIEVSSDAKRIRQRA